MTDDSLAAFVDHYATLAVEFDADRDTIRRAFRRRLLEAHPDKSAEPTDGLDLALVMRAWEILGDPDLRDSYDRIWRLHSGEDLLDEASRLPHVTESDRPQNRARSILFLLLEDRADEALERLRTLGEAAPGFLREHLDSDEFIDSAFLIAELFEARKSWVCRAADSGAQFRRSCHWGQSVRLRRLRNRPGRRSGCGACRALQGHCCG